jgi:hypothetical protein
MPPLSWPLTTLLAFLVAEHVRQVFENRHVTDIKIAERLVAGAKARAPCRRMDPTWP